MYSRLKVKNISLSKDTQKFYKGLTTLLYQKLDFYWLKIDIARLSYHAIPK